MGDSSSVACPSCGHGMDRASDAACPRCGFAPRGGIVIRERPQNTRGLEALSRKFSTKWLFGFGALMWLVAWIYYSDIGSAEHSGGELTVDIFTKLAYDLGGKWAAVCLWLMIGGTFFYAGIKAVRRGRE